jgi:hypothetical protein
MFAQLGDVPPATTMPARRSVMFGARSSGLLGEGLPRELTRPMAALAPQLRYLLPRETLP